MNETILVVEDQVELLGFLNQVLQKKYIVQTANNYIQAEQKIKKQQFDIILSDHNLRDGKGTSLISFAKKLYPNGYTRYIIATSLDKVEFVEDLFLQGADGFLSKPYSVEKIERVVQKLINKVKIRKQALENEYLLKQYQIVVDKSNIVSKTDPKGKITYVNDLFCTISGFNKEELIGAPHNIVRHPDMPKEAFRDLWETIQEKKIWQGIVKNRKKDGGFYYVDATIMPVFDSDGSIKEYIGLRHDITELEVYRSHIEQQLNDNENSLNEKLNLIRQYETAFDFSTAVSRSNKDGTITYVNEKFCKLCGYTKEELLGVSHSIVKSEETSKQTYDELWKTITQNKIYTNTLKNRAKNGSYYWVNITIVPIYDQNGNIVEFVSLSHDITQMYRLKDEIIQTQKDVIFQLGAIGEMRSKETGNHVKRVAYYSHLLAQLYGLSKDKCDLLLQASPMHDIGKIGISDAILNKPGPLNDEEFAHIKEHSMIGYKMLAHSNRDILKAAAIIAKEHHERWDGKGYPEGLKEDKIHIFGRITAVADVFDALGSDRCYKKAWDLEKIVSYFEQNAGIQFDPQLCDLFLKNLDQFIAIRDRFSDIWKSDEK